VKAFKLILGTPVNAVPRPWLYMRVPGIMVNAFDLLQNGRYRDLRGRGLRKFLGIDDDVELWIDSGGYQFLKRGLDPGVDKLAKLYREIDADYYVSLDYPPSPRDEPRLRAEKLAKTIRAFWRLRSILRSLAEEGRLVPVFHMSAGPTLRLQLRAYEPYTVVAAAGGLVPYFMQLAGKKSRLKAVLFLALLRKLWRGRLHALGLASAAVIPLLRILGIDSGDTQTWRHKAAYGKIIVPGLGERHVSGKSVRFGPAKLRAGEEKIFWNVVSKVSASLGITVDSIREKFESRALFNAWVLLYVASNGLEYVGPSRSFARLYDIAREFERASLEAVESELTRLIGVDDVSVALNSVDGFDGPRGGHG